MDDKGYQGWKNYETWAVALWIDNEESLYRERLDRVLAALTDAHGHKNVDLHIWTLEEAERFLVADDLKEWISDMQPDLGATLWSDLLTAAIGEVDWCELADHWIPESKEDAA